ncbi:NUDIX hydrolase [Parascardovia denticolens]|uniref:NUDIX hydrolase n=1 Tax=Parascardovia denticolens TaxID=78258 RepID=UPI00248D7E78|nr:NUDIX hydrolase [Parascardovia denticolens]
MTHPSMDHFSDFSQILRTGYHQYAYMGKKAPVVLAGGAVVWRLDQGRVEVCLVHRPRYDDWSWPKGKLEAHESIVHCAVREVQEEIGLPIALGAFLGHTSYPLLNEGKKESKRRSTDKQTKHCFYWSARLLDPDSASARKAAIGPIRQPDPEEINQVLWLPLDHARHLLTQKADKAIADVFAQQISAGLLFSTTVLLTRHAKAEDRKNWIGQEADRPLTPVGASQAHALQKELAAYAPARLYSSPWLRCQQTMEPYSLSTGLSVTPLPSQTEDACAADPRRTWDGLQALLRDLSAQHESAAICMHRPVIGAMLGHLSDLCQDSATAREIPRKNPYLSPGQALVLALAPARLTAFEPQASPVGSLISSDDRDGSGDGDNSITIIDIYEVTPFVY